VSIHNVDMSSDGNLQLSVGILQLFPVLLFNPRLRCVNVLSYLADRDNCCRWGHVVVAPWPAGTIQTSIPQQQRIRFS